MIKRVKFASVPVTDQDRALEFYTKGLGFRVITDSPFDESQRWIELGIPRAETRLVLFTAPGQEALIGGFMNVVFAASDVEATVKELKDRGGGLRAGSAEGRLGDVRDLQGSGRQSVRARHALTARRSLTVPPRPSYRIR